ncbi:MAG TPA: efflux RND transporter periplasmic adaptor subunit [Candidatus Marinimicrobia bacterium]|jgi:Cu(I)/Ag(I) efflux system membrane fusion protein/cobalt-zinc-cadmium efflux system membrane fusion protein|nr:efflux transporter periplasmic adaptor subunit [Candidatus Neomarinimicrobiota bacterium]MDP6296080.1 efflux RND transporter periplasmic adaptor subunit [Candidatus Neomarinimicrobiota bacterium]MDP7121414.1 efflux RND transporter periplasmic adaptor subunit [Candidatus Neomarinimicrobiota bacterium]MDP7484333.1 efflux RND transporter periplasmic adaptor subunit [Candidatus Neomarinimicrobiota bacterium]MDP7527734.1 efflux RND transporter periplasmic adaptor subunit [Candidatus Neomarinimicr|tara:strand:- start:2626 stop:3894 length:1269 start_codon:yes stop_codon:yes gene_type:complete
MMKYSSRYSILMIVLATVAALSVGGCGGRKDSSRGNQEAEVQFYSCGMHPNVIQEGPGNCPICGMNLTPMGIPTGGTEETFGSTVKIDPTVEQNMGIRTAEVEKRDLTQTIRTIGRIDYNESKVAHVHTKFNGWIEKTHADITGQRVNKGQPLLDIYSPELVSAQEEYFDALKNVRSSGNDVSVGAANRSQTILGSTRRRLEYFDVSGDQIDDLERTGNVRKTLTVRSPFEGIVIEKHALDGMEVKPGMMIYTIADLSEIWVYADIYEFESPWVKEGLTANMTLSYDPGKRYRGKVQYIYPYLEEETRTIKVRLSFPNPNLKLKPGMYANVEIETSPLRNVVAVPMEAVLFSGERNLVFIVLGDGRFAPRDITVGIESGDGFYEVKEGLSEGVKVVASGQFLLDSESKLQESIAKLLSKRKE